MKNFVVQQKVQPINFKTRTPKFLISQKVNLPKYNIQAQQNGYNTILQN